VSHTPSSLEIERPLAPDEFAVIRWLLEHGNGDNSAFLEQLNHARVARLCRCGCASIDLSIDGRRPAHLAMRVLSDYQWRNDLGHRFGAFVFEQDGLLAGLDLWSIDGESTPDSIPAIESLVPYGKPSRV
jgi:hypothetical protein